MQTKFLNSAKPEAVLSEHQGNSRALKTNFQGARQGIGRRQKLSELTAMGVLLDEETANKVIRQVEFYFSDSNLPRDKFLKRCLEESEDEMVSLALVCSFSRMRSHLGIKEAGPDNISDETVSAVADILRKSSFLRLSEDGKKVGRVNKLISPDEVQAQVDSRTIAAAPLPYDVKLEDIERFFGQYGKVNSVRLPRHVAVNKAFCGSALIEFSSEEEANNIFKLNLAYDGADLELKSKKDFDDERKAILEEKNNDQYIRRQAHDKNGSGRNHWQKDGRADALSEDSSYPKGLIIAFVLKKSSQGESGEANELAEAIGKESSGKATNDKSTVDATNKDNSGKATDEKDTVDATDNENSGQPMDGNKSAEAENKESTELMTREDIKDMLKKYGTVKYVDYTMGGDSGYVRFDQAEGAQKARTAAVLAEEGGLTVKNYIAVLEAVEGEAEREYWSKLREGQGRRRESGARGNRGRYGSGRGRHSRNTQNPFPRASDTNVAKKHKRFEDDKFANDEPQSKVSKVVTDIEVPAS